MKKLFTLGALLALAFASFQASANLLTNGGFEDVGAQTLPGEFPNGYGVYSEIPGWVGVNSIEIHPTGFIADAQDGKNYAELNAHPSQNMPFELHQTFDTIADAVYKLSFYAQKRRAGDEEFFVNVGDVMDHEISSHVTGSWTLFELMFTATGAESTLAFVSGQAGSDTVGHFLDSVQVSQVPLPGAAVLLLGGLLGLSTFKRKATA